MEIYYYSCLYSVIQQSYVQHLGCPSVIRADEGTENSVLAVVQPILRHSHTDGFAGEISFRFGRSTANQVKIKATYRVFYKT